MDGFGLLHCFPAQSKEGIESPEEAGRASVDVKLQCRGGTEMGWRMSVAGKGVMAAELSDLSGDGAWECMYPNRGVCGAVCVSGPFLAFPPFFDKHQARGPSRPSSTSLFCPRPLSALPPPAFSGLQIHTSHTPLQAAAHSDRPS